MKRALAAIFRARRAPVLERLESRYLMAGWSPVGPETLVNDATAGLQETSFEGHKAIAGDGSGQYVVVWSGSGTGDADGIYARRHDATGAVGASFRVNTTVAGVQTAAAVAMDDAGNFTVVWSSDGQDGAGWGVYGQRYSAAGVAQGPEFRVNVTTAGNQYQPSIAADADGDFVVTWTSANVDSDGLGIAARRYNAAGAAQGGEIAVNDYVNGDQLYSRVAADDAGNFVVVWQSDFLPTSSIGIFAQRFNASGSAVGSRFVVNTTITGLQLMPAIGMNALGEFVVAWTDNSLDGSGYGVFAQRYTPGAAQVGGEFLVNTTTAGDQQQPSVAVDDTGAFVIAWESAAQDASGWGAFAREYSSAGASIGAEFRLNTTTAGDQQDPSVAMVGGGDYVAVWSGNGTGDSSGVFLQRYENLAAGITVTPTSGLVTTESGGAATFTVVLNSRPTANVNISVASNDASEGTVSTALLTFTRNNWNTAQTVTVTGVNDALNDGDVAYAIVTGAATSTDADYSGRAVADVSATNVDTTPPPNVAPVVTTTGSTLAYAENAGAIVVDPAITVFDANDAVLTGATVSILGYIFGQDVLSLGGVVGITPTWEALTGTLTLGGVATMAQYQSALRAVTYRNDSDTPGVAARSIRFVISDGRASSNPADRAVAVSAVNDPPTAADESYATDKGAVLTVAASIGVLANDADVDGGALTTVLAQQALNGTVQLFADGSFTYTPAPGFWGTDWFTYSADDGAGGTDTATVTIQVVPAAGIIDTVATPPNPGPDPDPGSTPGPGPVSGPQPVPGERPVPVLLSGTVPPDKTREVGADWEANVTPSPATRDERESFVNAATFSTDGRAESSRNTVQVPTTSSRRSELRTGAGRAARLPAVAAPVALRSPSRVAADGGADAERNVNGEPSDADEPAPRATGPRSVKRLGAADRAAPFALVTAAGPLAAKLDAMGRHLVAADAAQNAAIRTVSQVALAMTAGYVMWSLRGASLLASLITSLPLWRSLDPLPILEARADSFKVKEEAKRRKAERKAARKTRGSRNSRPDSRDDNKPGNDFELTSGE